MMNWPCWRIRSRSPIVPVAGVGAAGRTWRSSRATKPPAPDSKKPIRTVPGSVTGAPPPAGVKVSDTPAADAVALAESVIRVFESTDRIVAPTGMPAPATAMPGTSEAVEGTVTCGRPLFVTVPAA